MKLLKYNPLLLILPVLIFSLGFITLLSTSPELAKSQLMYFIIGGFLYYLASIIDYDLYKYYWKYLYFGIITLLVFTFVLGEVRLGSVRWLNLGVFTFQPSEFAKIVLIITISTLLTLDSQIFRKFKEFSKIILYFVPVFMLVIIQPDLGTSIVLLAIFIGILFFAGLSKVYFIVSILVLGIFSSPLWSLLHDYQKKRILVFLNPSLDVQGSGYNVIQSIIAVGSGGLLGKGFGRGTQSHLNFLPAHWTDFIFASFAEEWGFVGVVALIILFILLLFTILYVIYKVKEPYANLLAFGVFMVFLTQFVINVGMNLGIMPVTGIPLPLVSYGGSSMLTGMILLGMVQNIWMRTAS